MNTDHYPCSSVKIRGLTGSVAMPDLGFRAFLAALDACAGWDFFRVAGGGFLDVPAFVFRDLGERTSREDRDGREFGDVFFSRVVIAMLDE